MVEIPTLRETVCFGQVKRNPYTFSTTYYQIFNRRSWSQYYTKLWFLPHKKHKSVNYKVNSANGFSVKLSWFIQRAQ